MYLQILKDWAEELGSLFGTYDTHNLKDGLTVFSVVHDELGLEFGHRAARLAILLQLGPNYHNPASLSVHFFRELDVVTLSSSPEVDSTHHKKRPAHELVSKEKKRFDPHAQVAKQMGNYLSRKQHHRIPIIFQFPNQKLLTFRAI